MLKSPSNFEMADDNIGDLYSCGGCTDQIPNHRARVSCHSCSNYHLCANCFVIKQFSKPHIDSHPTMVAKQSGVVVPLPPGTNARPASPLPSRPKERLKAPETESEIPMANWGALWSLMKAPLEKKSKKGKSDAASKPAPPIELKNAKTPPTTSGGREAKESVPDPPETPVTSFPPSPPKSVRRNTEPEVGVAPSYPQPLKWEPLFEEDSTPTPNFIALMSTVFSHLDPDHSGYLSPEIYSGFLDVQGYKLEANIWKRTLETKGREHPEVGDSELGVYFSDLGISHRLAIRPKVYLPDDKSTETKSPVQEKNKDSMKFGANMPMISRQGFIDLSAIEYLVDPTQACEHLGRAVSIYGIWKELGEMPRSVLPESSIPKVLRVDEESNNGNEGRVQVQGSSKPAPSNTEGKIKFKGGDKKVEALPRRDEFVDVDFTKGEEKSVKKGNSKIVGKNPEAPVAEEKVTKTALGEEYEQGGEIDL